MAAPNLQAPTTINGKTTYVSLTTTNETDLLANASSSGKALRVAHVTVCNTSTTAAVTITAKVYSAASGGTGYAVASVISVPIGGTLILVGKENPFWLEEDRRIAVTAGTANALVVTCSYEEIS